MNLLDLVSDINAQLDYNPDLAAYSAMTARTLNRFYVEVSGRHPWLFLQKEADFNVYATLTGSSSSLVTVTSGSHLVVFATETIATTAEGQTFVGPDGAEYTIGYAPGTTSIYLTAAYAGGSAATSASWSIQFRRYALPADCSEPLGFIDRANDRGRLVFIDRRLEESAYLDRDNSGDVFVIVEDDHTQERAPDPVATNSSNAEVAWAASASASAGGDLVSGVEYEYCYVFQYAGRNSPPSTIVSATATSTGKIDLVGMENTQDGGSDIGKRKLLYRRDKTNHGRWLLIKTFGLTLEATTTYTDAGSDPAVFTYQAVTSELSEQTSYQYVRAYYTAGSDATLRLRYLVKPRRLVSDSDVPLWPEACHPLLVYLTLQDVCLLHGMTQQAMVYERRANELLGRMKGKWLSRNDRMYVRQGFDRSIGRGRWGSVSKSDA